MDTNLSNAIHLINSDSAAGCVKVAFHLGHQRIIVNEDPIACGPAPYTEDLAQWRKTREQFLAELQSDWPDFSFDAFAERGLLMNAERLKGPETKIIWAGSGVSDQLFIAWVIFLFDCIGADLATLKIVDFETIRRSEKVMWRIFSIGELSPEHLREHSPEPRFFDQWEIDSYRKAWRVYTSDEPFYLVEYLNT